MDESSNRQRAAADGDLASLANDESLFAGSAREKLELLRQELAPLAEQFDVVVANPPYMGSSSLGRWMSAWVKKRYPHEMSDLCTSFIERGFVLCRRDGTNAMITMQSWMFLGSYERMRDKLLRNHSILSMAHLGTRAFGAIAGEVVSTTATVFGNAVSKAHGMYFRLVDMGGEEEKRAGYLEALANPRCGWFYRRGLSTFGAIPGSPIVYWAPYSLLKAFESSPITEFGRAYEGIKTGDNDRFLRYWFEITLCKANLYDLDSQKKWQKTAKAGEYRKWVGSHYVVTNFEDDGNEMMLTGRASISNTEPLREQAITWNRIGTGNIAFRYLPCGFISNMGGLCYYPSNTEEDIWWLLGFLNSSISNYALNMLNPTMNFPPGTINSLACRHINPNDEESTTRLAKLNVSIALCNWNSSELSWDFKTHPLV